ncbi:MAG: M4 family metallopeptidase [Lachnospiraceae bacterium]|nr:M4 family metallopeptidase [Lachnospiraceae bacterium]
MRRLCTILLMILSILLVSGCSLNRGSEEEISEAVEVNPNEYEIYIGEKAKLPAAYGDLGSWASSDESVVTVTAEGVITGVSAGEADITETLSGETSSSGGLGSLLGGLLGGLQDGWHEFASGLDSRVEEWRSRIFGAFGSNEDSVTTAASDGGGDLAEASGQNEASGFADGVAMTYHVRVLDGEVTVSQESETGDSQGSSGKEYTVSFDTDGGTGIDPVTVAEGGTIEAPEDPEKSGFIFVGWYDGPDDASYVIFENLTVTEDITLYAKWVEDNPQALNAEYVASQLRISYQQGDYAENVTGNITLQTAVDGLEDIFVSWSSSDESVIAADGTVYRPANADAQVTMTATVTCGEETAQAAFELTVIHLDNRSEEEIGNYSVLDIQQMNDYGAEIIYNEEQTQVTSIDGQYSDIIVENSDDALDSLQSIHSILGIRDAYSELDLMAIASDEYGSSYVYTQVNNGYEVYGYSVTACVDSEGVTSSLASSLLATETFGNVNFDYALNQETAEAAALAQYDEGCTVVSENTVMYIYALWDYETNPILVYCVNVTGTSGGTYHDDSVYVNADTGEVVHTGSNLLDASSQTGSGTNEEGKSVSFPVAFTWTDWYFYYMQDLDRDIQMYSQTLGINFWVGSELNRWTDETAVSAYTNMIKTYDWYKNTLNRDSVDGNGMKVNVIVHDSATYNNAYWSSSTNDMHFCDNAPGSTLTATTANALDAIAHEYTHGVYQYIVGRNYGYDDGTYIGAIQEGYSDIFGCLVEGDWEVGEDWKTIRSASDPESLSCPDRLSSQYYSTSNSGDTRGHTNATIVSHAAYLMYSNGMSKNTLAKLWYTSMRVSGYSANSDFYDVRVAVLKAAKNMGLSSEEVKIIKNAFDEVEVYDRGTLKGSVKNTDGGSINTALISIYSEDTSEERTVLTDSEGNFSVDIDSGTYVVKVTAEDYVEYSTQVTIVRNQTQTLNVTLVREGVGTVSGSIVSATTAMPLEGVTMVIREGYNTTEGDVVASLLTDSNGNYSVTLDAGYYTFALQLENYSDTSMNVQVQDGETTTANGTMSPNMSSDVYRVVLTWGILPTDLDSHLTGTAGDGTGFHIYYSDKYAVNSENVEIGNLDVDDTMCYGPETITFYVDTDGSYYYYVYKFSFLGYLSLSEANVKVYCGDVLIGDYDMDPTRDASCSYWNVFKIVNGIYSTVDTVTASAVVG